VGVRARKSGTDDPPLNKGGTIVLNALLDRLITHGTLIIIQPNERQITFGDSNGKPVIVRFRGALTPFKFALWPNLYLGEAYMDGSLVIERGTLWDLLDLLGRNFSSHRSRQDNALLRFSKSIARYLQQFKFTANGTEARRATLRISPLTCISVFLILTFNIRVPILTTTRCPWTTPGPKRRRTSNRNPLLGPVSRFSTLVAAGGD
jgi:hypothetical protein